MATIINILVYVYFIFKISKLEKQVQALQKDALNDLYKRLDIDAELWGDNDECEEKI